MSDVVTSRERRIKQSVSFRPGQFTALKEQAERERHGNLSLVVQRAVDRELERLEQERQGEMQKASAA